MRYLRSIIVLTAIGGCTTTNDFTAPPRIQGEVRPTLQYHITPLPTDGPGLSQGAGISNAGLVSGYTGMPDGTRQAAIWRDGVITPLGNLPGGHYSSVQWPGLNNSEMIVGIARTGENDPNNESWSCSAFLGGAGKKCLGFVWQDGTMSPLPTLGGPNGFAAGVNARGQIVGWAETPFADGTCTLPQKLRFRAVLWDPKQGSKQELPPFGTDATSAATAINDRGEVVGISGDCDVAVGRRSARHALLWDHGVPTDIGNLGGDFWHTPMAINARGDIVGFSNPPGGDLAGDDFRAFLWTRAGGIVDLKTFGDDPSSQALGINSRGQIVGASCADLCRAVIWLDGRIHELKEFVEPGFTGYLWSARGINDAGLITGRMFDADGNARPYIATPIAAPIQP
jgi:probable HAF family extracellular repeat protein